MPDLPASPDLRRRRLVAAAGPAALGAVLPAHAQGTDEPPPAPREFRAAWVATVANIDWPSRPGLDAAAQRAETLAVLDRARELRLNALVLQVRPAGDALYASTLEPWSEYLTGAQGRAPAPPYDPLAFWVEEAHRRGLELHAWFNPYRARHPSAKTPLAPPHLALSRPGLVKAYGELMWMDPGEADAAAHTLAVMADLLQRYDIDGLHMDDYFYPYPVTRGGVEQPFPDEPAWRRYVDGGGRLAREDWRRDNVDRLVQRLYALVRERKPHVRVGISPFGLGRPDRRPPGIQGFSQYDKLYADVERWLQEGWLDYLAPQLYWAIDRPAQAFGVLLDYWLAQNTRGRHIWPGLFTSRVGAPERERAWPAQEVVDQVVLKRTRPAASGHLHFSMVALMQDREGLGGLLRAGPYAQPALVPVAPWLGGQAPAAPVVARDGAALRLRAGAGPGTSPVSSPGAAPFVWALWQRVAGRWQFDARPATAAAEADTLALAAGAQAAVVSAVDRQGLESPRVRVALN